MRGADYIRQWKAENPKNVLISNVRQRAKRDGQVFTLTPADIEIPQKCPVLGIELRGGQGRGARLPSTPTLRVIDPALGYVPGNVVVISWAAYHARPLQGGFTDHHLHMIALDLLREIASFAVTPGAVTAVVECFKKLISASKGPL